MNSEKVKEIKDWLENESEVYRNEIAYNTLELINELESENERIKNIGLNEEMTVGEYLREMERLKAELEKEQINNLNCDTQMQYYEKRIAELEMSNEALSFAVKQGFNDCQAKTLKQFPERLKEKLACMKWQREDTNEKLIKQGATIKAIDETLKEFL